MRLRNYPAFSFCRKQSRNSTHISKYPHKLDPQTPHNTHKQPSYRHLYKYHYNSRYFYIVQTFRIHNCLLDNYARKNTCLGYNGRLGRSRCHSSRCICCRRVLRSRRSRCIRMIRYLLLCIRCDMVCRNSLKFGLFQVRPMSN